MNKNSVVLTASDAGWINGHTYSLFGPLSFGATTILVESPLIKRESGTSSGAAHFNSSLLFYMEV